MDTSKNATADPNSSTAWRPFTVPNLMSLFRLLCIPVFVWLLFSRDDRYGAALLLAVLGSTDWVDGWFARRFDQVSELGKLLDPTADRLMMLTAVICTWIDGSVPWWFAALTLVREGLVSIAALILGSMGVRTFEVTWWGKTGTFLLMFAFPLLLAGVSSTSGADLYRGLGWLSGIPGLLISWYAAIDYARGLSEVLANRRVSRGRIDL